MPDKFAEPAVAARVELAIGRIDSISLLPSAAAKVLSEVNNLALTPQSLAQIVESDPALALTAIALCRRQFTGALDPNDPIRSALDRLSLRDMRDAVLASRVRGLARPDDPQLAFAKNLTKHSVAVACCAAAIAELLSPALDRQLAYAAGLLHDIGKFALDESMPKSFIRIVEEAARQKTSCAAVEHQYLGLDHTILGKHIAQKLRLPSDIILAIWLHHSNTTLLGQRLPRARLAQVLELADSIVRTQRIGESGSFDTPVAPQSIAASLGLTDSDIEKVAAELARALDERVRAIDLDAAGPQAAYCDALRTTTMQFAADNARLTAETANLEPAAAAFTLTNQLLSAAASSDRFAIAEVFALQWQKIFETGPVCILLAGEESPATLPACVADKDGKAANLFVNPPQEFAITDLASLDKHRIFDASDYVNWLFAQLETPFDLSRTKLVLLPSNDRMASAVVFEQGRAVDQGRLSSIAQVVAPVVDIASDCRSRQALAECFSQLLQSRLPSAEPPASPAQSAPPAAGILGPLAEMAAGAAHELNNPLTIVAGRSQLLASTETDPEKKRILEQIRQNAAEISDIITDLMNYANPPQPRPADTPVKQILDEAVELAARKLQTETIDVTMDIAADATAAHVDSGQVASALAAVIANAVESYPDSSGPVKVAVSPGAPGEPLKIIVSDTGCGMDEETLEKAAQPFFSAKPAGRKRGMGLAHASRLIRINRGDLAITGKPGLGTTVTLTLPATA